MTEPAATFGAAETSSTHRTAASLTLAWAASAVAARRAGAMGVRPVANSPRLQRGLTRFAVWVEILGGLGRVHPDGTAVATVAPPRLRDKPRLLAVMLAHDVPVAAALVVAWLWWWPAAASAVVVIAMVLVAVAAREHKGREVRRRLEAVTPRGAFHLRNFFADEAHTGAAAGRPRRGLPGG